MFMGAAGRCGTDRSNGFTIIWRVATVLSSAASEPSSLMSASSEAASDSRILFLHDVVLVSSTTIVLWGRARHVSGAKLDGYS